MNAKKLVVILIAFAFSLIMIFSCVALLAVKKIQIDFNVSSYSSNQGEFSSQTSEEVQKLLNEYIGVSLLSIDAEQVEQKLIVHPKLEMVEVVKKFPNVLCVNLKERREVYKLEYNDKTYILDEFGFVLTDDGKTTQGTSLISLSLEKINNVNIEIIRLEVGQKIKISNDANGEVFSTALNVAKSVGLADCIERIELQDTSSEYDLFFQTRTGTKIIIRDIMIDGVIKTQKAFEIYDTKATDYQKSSATIEALYTTNENGIRTFRITHEYEIDGKTTEDLFEQLLNN